GVNALQATANWDATSTSSPSGYGDNICDKLWYDDPSNQNDGDTGTAGRSSLKSARTALPTGTDYAESGTLNPLVGSTTAVTRYAPCETTFTTGQNFKGSVYSRDAFYLSNETTGGGGPRFSVPTGEKQYPALWTGWQSTSSPAVNGAGYRSFPVVGGSAATVNSTSYQYTQMSSPYAGLSLPTTTGITAGTCTFSGPTQVALSGSTATVTSPGTTTAGASCPGSRSGSVWTVPVTTTTLYVGDGSGSLSSAAMNSVFNPPTGDITYYSKSAGDAYLSGTLSSGKLSLVTSDDIVVTGNTGAASTTTSTTNAGTEPSWSQGMAAVDLVATNDVRVYHPVTCATGVATYGASAALSPSGANPNGWCPNDITGLYSTTQSNEVIKSDGTLRSVHPSLQYNNVSSVTEPTTINAAVFALNGSLYADNFDRGTELGTLTVTGGVYQNHHGLLGEEWTTPTGSSVRHYSGFKLKINYLDYSNAGLGYVPELNGGNDLEPWQIVNVASGGPTP
ncbi:hypothetical protein, partial [Jatrophihabitans endophyticus]|uniref:hypothetical protein n=1 Tax=Jatrophihabitans endophyticus TaxID=1206085 RepID=UPI0019DE57B7